jgi:hypothetical protein
MKQNSIAVVGRSLETTKTVKDKNLHTNNVTFSEKEKKQVLPGDVLTVYVVSEEGDSIGKAIYSGIQFHEALCYREKIVNRQGDTVDFYVLPYTKNKK